MVLDRDAGPNWYRRKKSTSIEKRRPCPPSFSDLLAGVRTITAKFDRIACQAGRPTILVLLPGWRREDVSRFLNWVNGGGSSSRLSTMGLRSRNSRSRSSMTPTRLGRSRPRSCKPGNRRRSPAGASWSIFPRVRRAWIPGTLCEIASQASRSSQGCAWYGHSYVAGVWSPQSLEDLAVELSGASTVSSRRSKSGECRGTHSAHHAHGPQLRWCAGAHRLSHRGAASTRTS